VPGVVLGAMRRVMRIAMIVVPYYGRKAFGGLRGFIRLNFRVTIPGVSGVSNPGLLI